ncbi:MAG: DEAD/DEAH box helicase [Candidatus Heimdallarchaeota archaeon]|nr:DEAD/DEAH box helicase [Candidatus Heimdallarchaeota archaeon]
MVFANGHLASESLNIILNKRGINSNIHRAGLSVKHRKSVEDKFRNGLLDVLVSTPTLELGIDIGSVDSVISVLTSLTHFVQRIGRAGRSGQKSFATLVLRGDDPISAYYARNPEDYLTELEPAFVEPNNEHVAYYQIISMLLDQPLSIKESIRYDLILDKLRKQKILHERKGLISLRDRKVGQILLRDFSIRGIGKSIKIMSNNRQIGERSLPIALRELHTGAIYLHGGKSYKVQRLNTKIRAADLVQIKSRREKTQAMRSIWPEVKDLSIETNFNGLAAGFGKIELTETITGYVKKDIFTGKVLNQYELEEPISHNFTTSGFILAMPKPIDNVSSLSDPEAQYYLGGTYHAIEHVLIESGNSLTGGGANQIGGVSIGDTGLIFVYDGNEGGSGLSKLLFEKLSRGLDRSLTIMEQCPCKRDDGCPRCTYSYYCGNNNTPLNRLGAIETLKLVGKTSTELILDYDGVETFIVNSDFPPV